MQFAKDVMASNIPSVIHEDEDILVVNKPARLVVHGDGRTREATLSDWLIETYPSIKEVGEPWVTPSGDEIYRPGIVHRLDRDTSGVMVIAKTQESFSYLKNLFQTREVHKQYDTIVYGHLKEKKGVIEKAIGRSPQDFRRWSAQPGARGEMREATTSWETVFEGKDSKTGELVTWLMAEPRTGRTHQIRVHLKAIHHPVICDPLYGEGKACLLGMERVALHARRITLSLKGGEERTFEAPLPEDMLEAKERIV